jgi:hypothetical protein
LEFWFFFLECVCVGTKLFGGDAAPEKLFVGLLFDLVLAGKGKKNRNEKKN